MVSIEQALGVSSATATSMVKYFRQLVGDNLDMEDVEIGGPGIVVEIDEAKFGKRKYNRGHAVDGAWVLGGVERTSTRKIFLVEVPDRREETLLDIISQHVKDGSIVHTDCFRSYSNLGRIFAHQQVNHSLHFKDPVTGCHTNSIEGTWNGIKMQISPRSRTSGGIDEHLAEFIWRRKWKENLWEGFIYALNKTEYL